MPLSDIFVDPDLLDDSFKNDAVIPSEGNYSHAVLLLLEFVSNWNQHRLESLVKGINDHFFPYRQFIVLHECTMAQLVYDWNNDSCFVSVDF